MAHAPVTEDGVTRVTMPQLGESVTEGQISRWLKQPGDRVEKYEALVEVITDKVNAEVPAPIAGVLAEINVQEGETVLVGTLICSIGTEAGTTAPSATEEIETAPTGGDLPPPQPPVTETISVPAPPESNGQGRSGRASPAVRRLAGEHDLDISQITGTGIAGRVTKRDVDQFLAAGGSGQPAIKADPSVPSGAVAAPAPTAIAPPVTPAAPAAQPRPGDELISLTPIRKAIAEHMVRSRQTSPHAWCAVEVDMTSVVALRKAEREKFRASEGVDLTYVPFVTSATVEALKAHPEVNATWTAEGILRRRAINISIAVSAPGGLIVPVIHDADRLSIAGLAHQINDLATRARANQLKLPDIEGGTFCVNNPGTFGTVISAPIINQPQAAIMTMEAIVKRPVVLPGDLIGIRSIMFMGMSFDHRVIDGLEAASFLVDVKKNLEAMGAGTPIF